MNRMTLFAVLVALLAGCASRVSESERISLCAVLADPEAYSGKVMRMEVEYVADGTTYAFVRDPECGPAGMITGNITGDTGDDTYSKFMEGRSARCARMGGSSVCVVKSVIEATIEVKPDKDGVMSAFIRRVHSSKVSVD
jgi:hypothetical protein